jgi:hypothetical protein
MISRHSGDDIAASFSKILQDMRDSKPSQSQSGKVALASEGQDNSAHDSHPSLDDSPEKFLVSSPASNSQLSDSDLDKKIEDFASYSNDGYENKAEDQESCADDCEGCCKCYECEGCCECKGDKCQGCEICENNSEDDALMADVYDADDFVSQASKKLLFGLGKVASDLRAKEEHFAADMVEATALGIVEDLKKEASEKLEIISKLKKIASSEGTKGTLAEDLIQVTINKIKKS